MFCSILIWSRSCAGFLYEKFQNPTFWDHFQIDESSISVDYGFRSFVQDPATTRKLLSFRKYLFPFSIARQTREETDFREKSTVLNLTAVNQIHFVLNHLTLFVGYPMISIVGLHLFIIFPFLIFNI